jgi:hypothetical protein
MKTNTLKTLFGSVALGAALFAAPVATFAADVRASSTASFRINHNGVVQVLNAEVTSISGSVINAVTRLKDSVVNWAFTTNASTTIVTSGLQATSTPSLIRIGDRISVSGTLLSIGSTMNVTAAKVVDTTLLASWKTKSGKVQSVNTSNDKTITVITTASTQFKLNKATSTNTLAQLAPDQKVVVYGTISADGTSITAAKVVLNEGALKKEAKELKKEHKKDPHNNGKGRDDLIHKLKSSFDFKFDNR